jgi:hypothetical protein
VNTSDPDLKGRLEQSWSSPLTEAPVMKTAFRAMVDAFAQGCSVASAGKRNQRGAILMAPSNRIV